MFRRESCWYLHGLLAGQVVGQGQRGHHAALLRLLRVLRVTLVQHVYLPPEVAMRETLQQMNSLILRN